MILVTGGAGFIGSNLVDLLLSAGHSVRVLDNLSSGSLNNLEMAQSFGDRFEFVQIGINDFSEVLCAAKDVKCIIHLAAQVSVKHSFLHPDESAKSNIIGFINMLEVARLCGIPRFIYASSAAVYGHPTALPLNENSMVNPVSPYGIEKLVNEFYAKLYQSTYGISCLGFRFFNVYGPRQDPNSSYAGVISKFYFGVKNNMPITVFGDGCQTRDFVYVQDVVSACAGAIKSNVSGILCVGTGRSVNLLELVCCIEDILSKKARLTHAENSVGDIVHSSMDPSLLNGLLGVVADVSLKDGLALMMESCSYAD